MPAISNKLADIPPDEYSWRKYGQKPIKGSPHPRYANFPICNCDYLFVPRTLLVMYKLDFLCYGGVKICKNPHT